MNTKPTIFISHSTGALPADDRCVLAKGALVAALERKGWHVFLDSHSVKGGGLWRTEILHSLATARAGIILLNEEASQSDWVKAEALIMCFRKSIDPAFPLLPVVFPGADIDATFLKTYQPFEFNEIQRVTVEFAAGGSVEAFVQELAESPHLERGRQAVPRGASWVQKVADLFGGLDHDVLCRAATKLELQLEPELLTAGTREALCLRLRWALANLMHHKQAQECLHAIAEMMAALPEEKASRLKPHLLSKWVDNESAEVLLHSIRAPVQQGLLVLNASRQKVADCYTARVQIESSCEDPNSWVISIEQPNADYDETSLVRKVEQAIRAKLLPEPLYDDDFNELPLDSAIKQRLGSDRVALCVLPMQYLNTEVLKDLRGRFPRIIFIALAGEKGQRTAECHAAGGVSLNPQLTPQKLNDLSKLLSDLNALFEQHFHRDPPITT